MKKLVLFIFCSLLATNVWAQNQYVKHIFEAGRSSTIFQDWKSWDISRVPFTDVAYTFFAHKNIGIRLAYHVNTKEIPVGDIEKYKYLVPNDPYYHYRYIEDRRINCYDLLASYRANYKKHNLYGSLGLSWRRDRYHESYDDPYLTSSVFTYYSFRTLGYALSLSYQYRVFRNFGISAEGVFRSSKNIPNTFTYGIRFSYLIWNKRKEKEKK